jgi:hypothetical protein
MTRLKIIALSAVCGVTLLGTVTSGVFAASPAGSQTGAPATQVAHHAARITGTIASVATTAAGSSIVITRASSKTVTVQLASTTRYLVNGQVATTAPQLTVGETVRMVAVRQTTGVFLARVVMTGTLPSRSGLRRIGGTVSGASSTQLVISRKSGKVVTIELTSATKYYVDGKFVTAVPTIAVGSTVFVVAQRQSTGDLAAKVVAIGKGAARVTLLHARGTVVSFNGVTLTVQLKSGATRSFTVTAKTRFVVNGQKAPSTPSLTQGETVLVLGRKTAAGYDAAAVIIRTA